MIVILYHLGCEPTARVLRNDLQKAYLKSINVVLREDIATTDWPDPPSWDDLLVLMYDEAAYPDSAKEFINKYRAERSEAAPILPVAISTAHPKPPRPADGIKAIQFDRDSPGPNGRISRRVGAMLGLRLQGRDTEIFISHKSTDGAKLAAQLYDHLKGLGLRPWLDVAKDYDGEALILSGEAVQNEINEALERASLLLLLDTPGALSSKWIKHEIDTANGMLLPILPISFRAEDDPNTATRFRVLNELQRHERLALPLDGRDNPLSAAELDTIVRALERYLTEILRRKCRVPFLAKEAFKSNGFDWREHDRKRNLYRSQREARRVTTKVLTHCSIFDQIYTPSLTTFRQYHKSDGWAHHPLFIYDGAILPDHELEQISKGVPADNVIILNYQELAALINSNFTTL
jgi:hypothetical protein